MQSKQLITKQEDSKMELSTYRRLRHPQGRRHSVAYGIRLLLITGVLVITSFLYAADHHEVKSRDQYVLRGRLRVRRSADEAMDRDDPMNRSDSEDLTTISPDDVICTEPAYHEFPPDAFSTEQRASGAIIIHILIAIYMFYALAIVCDVYFVASLEKICDKLQLSSDVAGATFMAAGSSAPELFTSIIGVFIAKGDVGVGTIVGSAVFNILFVIGICGIMVTEAVSLSWYPFLRDTVFYLASVSILMASIAGGSLQWFESLLMLAIYGVYIVVMKYNSQLQALAQNKITYFNKPEMTPADPNNGPVQDTNGTDDRKFYGQYEVFSANAKMQTAIPMEERPTISYIAYDEYIAHRRSKLSFEDACFRFMKMRGFRPVTRFRSAVYIIILERRKLLNDPIFRQQHMMPSDGYQSNALPIPPIPITEPEVIEDWRRKPGSDQGLSAQINWLLSMPIKAALYFTIPDCRHPRWEMWFLATFILSIVWIAFFSYIMVWMVVLIGYTAGVPDSIMGITFLAAGTSVPDCMASVMVARQGQGDMAVSNTIGSNVFDILIGLALPWFIMTALVDPGSRVHINSNGMIFSVILLFLTVLITLSAIHLGGWVLDRKLGYTCMISYAIFLVISCMIEFNVFGYVNAPMCKE